MNERELAEKIKEHLGPSVLIVNAGKEQYAISVHTPTCGPGTSG